MVWHPYLHVDTYRHITSNDFLLAENSFQVIQETMTERERFTTTINSKLLERLKVLAIYQKCTTNKLLDEAIRDLLKKYEKKGPKNHP